MSNVAEIKQKRATIVAQMEDIVKQLEVTGLTEARKKELDEQFVRAEADEAELSKQAARLEKLEQLNRDAVDKVMSSSDTAPHTRASGEVAVADAVKEYLLRGLYGMSSESRAILEKRGTNTQVEGTTTLGGYLVQSEIFPEIIKSMKAWGGMLQVARTMYTAKGNTIYIPTNDDTSAKAVLVSEGGAFTVNDTTYGQKSIGAYAYRDLMKLSWELMQDAEFNMENEITSGFGPRFGRALNAHFTTGTGSSQPYGALTQATLGVTAATTSAFTRSEIVELVHKVDPAYRNAGNCVFMFNDAVLAAIKKLALGSGDASPLWQPSIRVGEPDTLEGFRYVVNQDMSSTFGTGEKLIMFGDFTKYLVRITKGLEIKRLDELYAGNGTVGFYGFMRADGVLLDTAAVKYLKLA